MEDKNPQIPMTLWTPLHEAAVSGHFTICELILQYATDKNPMDGFGATPLFLADQHGHPSICDLIRNEMLRVNPKRRRKN